MAFQTLGFHAALILNRLRNEKQITEDHAANDGDRREHNEQEQHARAEFIRLNDRLLVLNKKLTVEAVRVEPIRSGGSAVGQTERKNV